MKTRARAASLLLLVALVAVIGCTRSPEASKARHLSRADRALQEAIAREPTSVDAQLILGDFYASRRDAEKAERAYQAAAALGAVGSVARLRLADFYFTMQRPDDGKRVLQDITAKASDFLPGWRRLAEVALVERRYDDAVKALVPVFKKNPADFEGRLLRGRIHLARGETVDAIQDFQAVLKTEPSFAPARYHLALAYLAAGNVQQAKAELKDVTADFPDAALLLADLHLQTGATDPAIDVLTRLVAKHPNFPAYVLLGSAYLRKNEPVNATTAFETIVARAPKDPRGPYLVGVALLAQGKRADAKKRFEEALALTPDYVDPLVRLADLAIAERRADDAVDRVQRQ